VQYAGIFFDVALQKALMVWISGCHGFNIRILPSNATNRVE
jgi:hypothetical protein